MRPSGNGERVRVSHPRGPRQHAKLDWPALKTKAGTGPYPAIPPQKSALALLPSPCPTWRA